MAIEVDAFSSSTAGTTNRSWTHTPVGTPKAVCVIILQQGTTTDQVTSVTYGGSALVRSAAEFHAVGGNDGSVYVYHLGSNIPAGPQTVLVTVNGSSTKRAGAYTCTADRDTTIAATAVLDSDRTTTPSATLTIPQKYQGVSMCAIGGLYDGASAPTEVTPGAGYTANLQHDFGSQVGMWQHKTIISGATVVFDAATTNEEAGIACVALAELAQVQLPVITGSYTRTGKPASVFFGHKILASVTGYTRTGLAAAVKRALVIVPDSVDYLWNPNDAGLISFGKLHADTQSYASSGKSANFLIGYKILAATTSYPYTGVGAGIIHGRPFPIQTATFSLSLKPGSVKRSAVHLATGTAFFFVGTELVRFTFSPQWKVKVFTSIGLTLADAMLLTQNLVTDFLSSRPLSGFPSFVSPILLFTTRQNLEGQTVFEVSTSLTYKE